MMPKDPIKAEEARRKMSVSTTKRMADPKERERIAETQKKRLSSPEARAKMSVVSRTALADPIVKEKMREVQRGKKDSAATKERKRLSHLGVVLPPFSDEHKNNIRSAAKKRFADPEERKRVSEKATGRTIPKEVRTKMRNSQKKAHALDPDLTLRKIEGRIGGFWYGNVKYWYSDSPQYCEKFNAEFKERVRAFWGYACFQCGTPQNGKKLGVHHIHYDKKMCCNGSPQDCIPLCGSCHPKTNYNRDYWEDYFTELLYAYSPDGKCFFTKEEMKKFTSSIF